MENQNLPIAAKKIWSIVRSMYVMLRKGIISKAKLLADLNSIMQRGKIARKAIMQNLIFHFHQNAVVRSPPPTTFIAPMPTEYEFSCSNTPAYNFPFYMTKNKHKNNFFFGCAHAPPTNEDNDAVTVNAVKKVFEMLNANDNNQLPSVAASPAFGRSPAVRPLRVTDSPFPLHDIAEEGDNHVDEDAEKFIARFYSELRRQTLLASPGPW